MNEVLTSQLEISVSYPFCSLTSNKFTWDGIGIVSIAIQAKILGTLWEFITKCLVPWNPISLEKAMLFNTFRTET